MQFEVIDRPARGGGNVPDALVSALMETKKTGKAIRVQLEPGATFVNWQAAVRARVRNHGLRLRARHNKARNTVTCWCEDFKSAPGENDIDDVDLGVTQNGDSGDDE